MANPTNPPQPVSTTALIAAGLAGLVVVVVATIVSYSHMHELCVRAGEGDLAKLIPASVDGLVFFASTLLYVQHRGGDPKSKLAVFAAVLGVGMSIVANVVSKVPDLVPLVVVQVFVAAWAPAALGMVGHLAWKLLTIALRAREEAPREGAATYQQVNIGKVQFGPEDVPPSRPGNIPTAPQGTSQVASREHRPGLPVGRPEIIPSSSPGKTRRSSREPSPPATDDDLMVFVRRVRDDLASDGGKLTGYKLRKAFQDDGRKIGNTRAQTLAERAMAEAGR